MSNPEKCQYIFLKGVSKDTQCPLNAKVVIDGKGYCNRHSKGKKVDSNSAVLSTENKPENKPSPENKTLKLQPGKQFVLKPKSPSDDSSDDDSGVTRIELPDPGREDDRLSQIESEIDNSDLESLPGSIAGSTLSEAGSSVSVKSTSSTISVDREQTTNKIIESYYTKFPILAKVLPIESIEHLSPQEQLEKLKMAQASIGSDMLIYSGYNCINLLTEAMANLPGYSQHLNPFFNGMSKELLDELAIIYFEGQPVLSPEMRLLYLHLSTAIQIKTGIQIQAPIDSNSTKIPTSPTTEFKPVFEE